MNKRRLVGLIQNNKKEQDSFKQFNNYILESDFFIKNSLENIDFWLAELGNNKGFDGKYKNDVIVQIDGLIENLDEIALNFNIKYDNQNDLLKKLYDQIGIELERYLLGNFVIVIFDNNSFKLHIIRDHYGTKPIYYFFDSDKLIFGSEIKFIKAVCKKTFSPNLTKIANYLCQYKPNCTETFYEEIFSIEPSSRLTFFRGEVIVKNYNAIYDFSFKENQLSEGKKEFKAVFTNACRSKLDASQDSLVLLSGGLDSAVVYKTVQNITDSKACSMSMNFFDRNDNPLVCDESSYQEEITNSSKKHKKVLFQKDSPYEKIDYWLQRFDQPFNLSNIYLFDKTYAEAKALGFKQIIDGIDGDLVVSHGWERFKELFSLTKFPLFIYELFRFRNKHNYKEHTEIPLINLFVLPLIKGLKVLNPIKKLKRLFTKNRKESFQDRIVKSDFLRKNNFKETYIFSRNYLSHREKLKNPLIETAFVNKDILLFKHDINQASPFFNKRVVDLCVSFPSNFKLRHGSSRYILREAFKDELPEKIYQRFTKSNLTHNFTYSISLNDFKNILKEIESIHPIIKDIIDKQELKNSFYAFKNGSLNDRVNMNIWCFYQVNKWLKQNF